MGGDEQATKQEEGEEIRCALPFADEAGRYANDTGEEQRGRGHCHGRRMLLQRALCCVLGALALWGLMDVVKRMAIACARPSQWWSRGWRADGLDWMQHECFLCGETWQEAVALGCQFDELASLWLRPQCIDAELSREFSRSGPGPDGAWPYYLSPNDTSHRLSATEVSMLDDLSTRTHTVFEWHVQHCIFYWRKLFRQPLTRVVMEPHFDVEHHVVHCGLGFLLRNNLSSITTTMSHVPPRGMVDMTTWQPRDTYHTKYEQIPP